MPVPAKSLVITRRLLRDEIFDHLLASITNGAVRPGERLNVDELAQQLGVSKTPVREALSLLQARRFVETRPRSGVSVARLSAGRLAGCLEVIHALIAGSISTSRNAFSGSELSRLRGYSALAADADAEGLAIRSGQLGSEVVGVFIERIGNSVVMELWLAMQRHIHWLLTIKPQFADTLIVGPARMHELVMAAEAQDAASLLRVVDAHFRAASLRSERQLRFEANSGDRSLFDLSAERPTGGKHRSTLSHQARDAIERAILDGVLEPGERLREDELVRWLGISRTPIKEALRELELVGMIEIHPGKYCRVAPIRPRRVGEALRALELFAPFMVSSASHHHENADGWTALMSLLNHGPTKTSERSTREAIENVLELVMLLATSAGNPVLSRFCAGIEPTLIRWAASDLPSSGSIGVALRAQTRQTLTSLNEFRLDDAVRAMQGLLAQLASFASDAAGTAWAELNPASNAADAPALSAARRAC